MMVVPFYTQELNDSSVQQQQFIYQQSSATIAFAGPTTNATAAATAQFLLQMQVTYAPTHTDVLLGRGVATNRHPGNENFRAIVGQHVVST